MASPSSSTVPVVTHPKLESTPSTPAPTTTPTAQQPQTASSAPSPANNAASSSSSTTIPAQLQPKEERSNTKSAPASSTLSAPTATKNDVAAAEAPLQQPKPDRGDAFVDPAPSPALKALQRSAKEVHLDDSLDGGEALIKAANELAAERNLPHSPSSRAGSSSSSAAGASKSVRIIEPSAQTSLHSPERAGSGSGSKEPTRSDSPVLKGASRGKLSVRVDDNNTHSIGGGSAQKQQKLDEQNVQALLHLAGATPGPHGASAKNRPKSALTRTANASSTGSSSNGTDAARSNVDNDEAARRRAQTAYLKRLNRNPSSNNSSQIDAADDRESAYGSSANTAYTSSSRRTIESANVSRLLAESKDRGDGLIASVSASAAQEALFLSMRRVKRNGGGGRRDGHGPRVRDGRSRSPDSTGRSDRDDDRQDSSRRSNAGSSSVAGREVRVKEIVKRVDRLSRPSSVSFSNAQKKQDPTLRYMLFDDAEECTFRPPKARKHAASEAESKSGDRNGSDAKGTGGGKFWDKMAEQERLRMAEMEFKEGQADYNAKVDKKFCPNCGGKQNYQEVCDKKTKCPVCQVDYRRKVTWAQVSKHFFSKEKEYNQRRTKGMQDLIQLIEDEHKAVEQLKFDRATGKVIPVSPSRKAKWTEETEKAFFERMEQSLERRERALEELDDELYGDLGTFYREKRDEDEDEEEDKVGAFLSRLDEDIETRRETQPYKFKEKVKPDPAMEGKPSWTPI